MRNAVFLDRDGVINKEIGDYVYRWSDFEFNDGLFEALRILTQKGYCFIIVTNQGGIDKGLYTEGDVESLMESAIEVLKSEGIEILEYYYSPHHSAVSQSIDRKPDSVMIEKGAARFNINVRNSYIIGDSDRDILAGRKVGLRTVKIDSNQNLLDIVDEIDDC